MNILEEKMAAAAPRDILREGKVTAQPSSPIEKS